MIHALASQFRSAIESTPKERLPVTFGSFPRGSCGDACLLLGAWLEDNGHGRFEYVCGEKMIGECRSQSHAWLQRNEMIVDITSDQFGADMPAVYVGPPTSFYSSFTIETRNEGHFRIYDERTRNTLSAAYQLVKSYVA